MERYVSVTLAIIVFRYSLNDFYISSSLFGVCVGGGGGAFAVSFLFSFYEFLSKQITNQTI